jgi:hypothetical protein
VAKNKVLNITEIEDGIKKIVTNLQSEEFITKFLSLYDIPKTSVTRANKQFGEGEPFVIKNKLYYVETDNDVVVSIDTIEQKIKDQKSKPRYIVANNFAQIAALDTKTHATLNIPINELPANADFFLAWNGIEKADYQAENPADRKAAERFARLYDVIAKDNPSADEHAFNLFLIRVLFLLFAEDTGIMEKGSFTNVLKTRTSKDGSNFNQVIKELFEVLDVPKGQRNEKSDWLLDFPYVNGKLFGEAHVDLVFTKVSRELLIEAGELLNWNEINPDILGAMIQSVASAEDRHVSGMHYTSVPNIMKVINPLFMDELNSIFNELELRYEENEKKDIEKKSHAKIKKNILRDLRKLLDRISKIKFLDPASGSGNFLIIAYKEIRRLEIKILLLIEEIEQSDILPLSAIHLGNFNGIELDDFAHEVAKLSLWIAEHQMNEELVAALPGAVANLLPLKDAGNIVCANSLRVDWNVICPHSKNDEVYLLGNPPYIGPSLQTTDQKEDMARVFGDRTGYRDFDYILGWFLKGAEFLKEGSFSAGAFVTTNSITQGKPVSVFWPYFYSEGCSISFAYTSFKWNNSAKNNAGVTVVIIGFSKCNKKKYLYSNESITEVENITPYLTNGKNILVSNHSRSISSLPEINIGSAMFDDDNFKMEFSEYEEFKKKYPNDSKFFYRLVGSKEMMESSFRWSLAIDDEDYEEARKNPIIDYKLNAVQAYRASRSRKKTKEMAKYPWRFGENRRRKQEAVVIPKTSSENRKYVPMSYYSEDYVISDAAFTIYDAPIWLLGLLESRMHMVWLRSIGGKLKTDYRYSAGLVYNTFPIRNLSTQRKNEMARVMMEILDLREYEGGSLATLYNKDTMPESLRKKHEELDGIVDRAYQQRPFESDEERLAVLLKLYQEMTEND